MPATGSQGKCTPTTEADGTLLGSFVCGSYKLLLELRSKQFKGEDKMPIEDSEVSLPPTFLKK